MFGGIFSNIFGGKKSAQVQHPPQNISYQARSQVPKLVRDRGMGGKYKQDVDTNVFQISMNCLKDQGELATGDPVFCTSCQAIFNKYSKIEEQKSHSGEDSQVWTCEFCNTKNNVELEPEELPKTEAVNFILEAAA